MSGITRGKEIIMACFVVPATEAIISTVVTKVVKHNEKKTEVSEDRIPFSKKLGWLNGMLWGGSALLMFEHVWHGEVTPWFPFLTAAADPEETAVMLHEMATSGVAMAIVVTLAWVGMLAVSHILEKKTDAAPSETAEASA